MNTLTLSTCRTWLSARREVLLVGMILLLAALLHGINMFGFPFYESDEGTYMSQAWAVVHLGQLAPYTYWYDHTPLGWFQLAAWTMLTGGFYTFGVPIHSGRVLMLLLQVLSTLMLYRMTRRITRSPLAATVAALAFALSAYGIYYHRRVLLDNIATPWMLLSILMLIDGPCTRRRIWISAGVFGIAILSKELIVMLFPALTYLVWVQTAGMRRWRLVAGWTAIVGAIVATYPLMALLRGEFFPPDSWLAAPGATESLISSLHYQMSRGKDGGLFDLSSRFWTMARLWVRAEPLLVILGTVSALGSVLRIRRQPVVGSMGLLVFSLWLFLARGGETLAFYLVPLLPLLALNLGLTISFFISKLSSIKVRFANTAVHTVTLVLCLIGTLAGYGSPDLGFADNPLTLWTNKQVRVQAQALTWIQQHIPTDSLVIIDQAMWMELHTGQDGSAIYPNAHYYWKVAQDPAIRDGVFSGDWTKVNYIITTPQLVKDAREQDFPVVDEALAHSQPVATFDTGGWPIEIRHVHPAYPAVPIETMLTQTWASYKTRFIEAGRVIDPQEQRRTTSEGQSYALLQAVYMDDPQTFETVWTWTKTYLQVREDALLAWLWGTRPDGTQGLLDTGSATDANQDTALALLFAAQRWNRPDYQQEALALLHDIWEQETTVIAGRRVLVAGDWARGDTNHSNPVINPSYFAPYAYRVFAQADPRYPWMDLVDSSYAVLEQIQTDPAFGGATGLVPNWLALDATTGQPLALTDFGPYASEFSYDASRLPWRLALDWRWFQEERARQAIARFDLLREELEQNGRLVAVYQMDGTPVVEYEAMSMYAGGLPVLLAAGDVDTTYQVFAAKVLGTYQQTSEFTGWGDPNNYYNQNWAWFTTALMDGTLKNLWHS